MILFSLYFCSILKKISGNFPESISKSMGYFKNRPFLLTVIGFILMSAVHGQKISGPYVVKPIYFDVSPPLRLLTNSAPPVTKETRKAEKAEKEIWNYFQKSPDHKFSGKQINDPGLQDFFGKIRSDSTLENFEGTPNVNTAIPPDTYGDVGPGYYVHMVNLSFTVFNKSGNILMGPVYSGNIWSGLPYSQNNGDGIVLYDDQADRWLISALCMPNFPAPPYMEMIAVSQTGDPTGSWYRWEYPFDEIPDYPKFGIWRDAYYMSCNRFTTQLNFAGIGAIAFDRTAMLNGDSSPLMELFKLGQTNIYYILPADCDGPFPPAGTPGYFMHAGMGFLGIYEFRPDWVNPAGATFGNLNKININPYVGGIQGIPQKGTSVRLDPISDRLMCRLQLRKFTDHQSMVVNHTIMVDNHAGIRWYELRRTTGNWSLYQQSTYSPDTNSRWMGSIAMDSAGNIALGYSVSGSDLYPSIRYTGRMRNDLPGMMTIAERSMIEGGGAQTHPAGNYSRWGDYSSMSVDPQDPTIFWYTQQYYPVTADLDWHTRVGSFSFRNILDIHAFAAHPEVCPGQPDQLDVDVSGGSGGDSFLWTSVPQGFTSTFKNPVVEPAITTRYFVTVTSGSQSKTDSTEITVIPSPEVFAGNDTVYCRYLNPIPLCGTATNFVSVKWITNGDGTFADPNSLLTGYFPGSHDRSGTDVDLELVAYPLPTCPVVSDHLVIRIDSCEGIPRINPLETGIRVFPDPSYGKVTIVVPAGTISMELFDGSGRSLGLWDISGDCALLVSVDISDKPSGIYTIRAILRNSVVCGKMIKW